MMHIVNIANALKKMTVNEIKDFIYENYCKRIGFSKENCYYLMKQQKKKDLHLFVTKLTNDEDRNPKVLY